MYSETLSVDDWPDDLSDDSIWEDDNDDCIDRLPQFRHELETIEREYREAQDKYSQRKSLATTKINKLRRNLQKVDKDIIGERRQIVALTKLIANDHMNPITTDRQIMLEHHKEAIKIYTETKDRIEDDIIKLDIETNEYDKKVKQSFDAYMEHSNRIPKCCLLEEKGFVSKNKDSKHSEHKKYKISYVDMDHIDDEEIIFHKDGTFDELFMYIKCKLKSDNVLMYEHEGRKKRKLTLLPPTRSKIFVELNY